VGFLESDYQAIHNGLKAALAGCDLNMPSGSQMHCGMLLPAIQSGKLPFLLIDDKVRTMLKSYLFKDNHGEDNDLVKVSFTVSNIGNRA
jgi:beta-glucosidase